MGPEHTYLRGIDPTILTGLRYKWDLSAQDDFLAWNAELSSVILSACPEARAPFVRYRSLTLSAVQLLTGAPPVSSYCLQLYGYDGASAWHREGRQS